VSDFLVNPYAFANSGPTPLFRAASFNQWGASTSAPRTLEANVFTQVGDLLLLWILEGTLVTVSSPGSGWTLAANGSDDAVPSGNHALSRLYSRVADGTADDDAAWTVSGATARRQAVMIAVDTPLRTVTAGAARSEFDTGSTMTVTPGDADAPNWGQALVLCGGWDQNPVAGSYAAPGFGGVPSYGPLAPPAGWTYGGYDAEGLDDGTNTTHGGIGGGFISKAVSPGTVTAPAVAWECPVGMAGQLDSCIMAVLTP
jgi:hypothetical protein